MAPPPRADSTTCWVSVCLVVVASAFNNQNSNGKKVSLQVIVENFIWPLAMEAWLGEVGATAAAAPLLRAEGFDTPASVRRAGLTELDLRTMGMTLRDSRCLLHACDMAQLSTMVPNPASGGGLMREWLVAGRLAEYLGELQKGGFDDVELLCDLTDEELDELITEDLQMKKGHARKLKMMLRKEKEQQASRQAPPVPVPFPAQAPLKIETSEGGFAGAGVSTDVFSELQGVLSETGSAEQALAAHSTSLDAEIAAAEVAVVAKELEKLQMLAAQEQERRDILVTATARCSPEQQQQLEPEPELEPAPSDFRLPTETLITGVMYSVMVEKHPTEGMGLALDERVLEAGGACGPLLWLLVAWVHASYLSNCI